MSDFGNMSQKYDPKGGIVEFGDDSRLYVEFYSRAVIDQAASREFNKPIHIQTDYIKIQQPGERDTIDRPAHDGDRRRFRNHWAAYQEGREVMPAGVPLVVMFPNNPEVVANLKVDKIFTVEQLAGLTDTQIQNVGIGARKWSQDAKAFLDAASSGAGYQALVHRLDQLESVDKAKDDKIAALTAALEEATEKKRGKAA